MAKLDEGKASQPWVFLGGEKMGHLPGEQPLAQGRTSPVGAGKNGQSPHVSMAPCQEGTQF